MSKAVVAGKQTGIEIVISTYWPTRIIKSVTIKDAAKSSYKDEITISAKDAKYLYEQLTDLYAVGEEKQ